MIALHRRAIPRSAPVLAALAIVVLSALPAGAQSAGERILTGWADALRGAGHTVEWGGLSQSLTEDRIELRDLVVTVPTGAGHTTRIAVPGAVFFGLAERPEGGFTARSVTVPNLTVTPSTGAAELHATDLEIRDAVVPAPAAPHLDPEHPVSSFWTATRLVDPLAAGFLALGRLDLTSIDEAKDRAALELRGLAVTGLAGLRIERIRLDAASLEAAAEKGRAALTLTDIEIEGWNAGAWRRALDDRDYTDGRGDGTWHRALAGARTGRIALMSDEARLSIERATLGAREVRQFDEPLGAVFDRVMARPEAVSPVDALRLVLETFLATRNDGWSIEGLHLSGPDLDHADLARLAVGAFSGDRLAEISFEGLDVAGRKALMKLARFHLADLRLPAADDLRRALPAALAGAEIDPSSLAPTFGRLAVEGLDLAEPGVPNLRLARLRLDLSGHLRAVPTAVDLVVDHFVVPAGLADTEGRQTLAGLGYDRVDVSAALRFAWNATTRDLVVDTLRLGVADLGEFSASARFVDVPRALFLRPEAAEAAIAGIRLAAFAARWNDASFFDRLVRHLAREEKTTPARLRRRLGDDAARELAGIRDPARRRAAIEAVRRFVANPKSLDLEMRAKAPVPLPEVLAASDDLFDLAERLDFSVSAAR